MEQTFEPAHEARRLIVEVHFCESTLNVLDPENIHPIWTEPWPGHHKRRSPKPKLFKAILSSPVAASFKRSRVICSFVLSYFLPSLGLSSFQFRLNLVTSSGPSSAGTPGLAGSHQAFPLQASHVVEVSWLSVVRAQLSCPENSFNRQSSAQKRLPSCHACK